MTRGHCLALCLVLGCGLLKGERNKPRRVAPRTPVRVAPPQRGPLLGADLSAAPMPTPSIAAVLGDGLLVGVSDGVGGMIDDDAALAGEVAWLAANLARGGDDDDARTLLRIRRAAFGVHVPRAGERAEIDDAVLDQRRLGIAASAVVLIGPEGPCMARRGRAIVTALDTGGHRLDVRWPLLDCGPGPWAPVGLVARHIPTTLRWEPPQCEEPQEVQDVWAASDTEPTTRLGVLRVNDEVVGLLGTRDDGNWLWVAARSGWQARNFSLAGKRVLECAVDDVTPVASESGDTL